MLIGAASQNLSGSDWNTLVTAFGPLTARRSYNGASDFPTTHGVPPSFAVSNAHIDPGLDVVTFYSFKPDIVLMAGSTLDSAVNGFLDSIPAGHKAVLSIWHEADGKVRGGQFTVAQFKAAFTHFCELVAAHSNPDIKTALILEAYQPTAPGTLYADMYPGACFDYFLTDGYNDLGSGDSVWLAGKEAADEWGVAWGIAEVGIKNGTPTAEWMATQVRWAMDHDAACFCWFDNSTSAVPTPGTGTAAVAAAQAISILLQVDPDEFTD